MAGVTDILTVIQNGVVALNNLGQQVTGSLNNISGQLTSLSSQVIDLNQIGQYVESRLASSLAIPLTTGVEANITSIALTSGDWDVTANVDFGPAATTNFTFAAHSISQVSSVSDFTDSLGFAAARWTSSVGNVPGNTFAIGPTGPVRKNLTVPTTIYAVVLASFTVSTVAAYGAIRARRAAPP